MKRFHAPVVFTGLLSACSLPASGVSDAQLLAGIKGAFADNKCQISGPTVAKSEARFERDLARRLGVSPQAVGDREGDIFQRGDKMVEDMVRSGEVVLDPKGPTATLTSCTPTTS